MRIVGILNVLRVLVFSSSLIALACHIGQCALLDIFQQQTNTPSWTEAGHWQYLVWYIVLGISMASGAAVCVHACCFKRAHVVRGDRFLGIVNIFLLFTGVLMALFAGGPEPWTAGYVKVNRPMWSFITSCSGEDTFPTASTTKVSSSLLYQRCVLSDSTWLGAVVALLFWMLLACLAALHRPASSVTADIFKEPKWGRYIPEPPPSLRSASIQIVPPPPPHHLRHSVVYNSYIPPRSDVSFDTQSVSTTLSYGKRASWQYYNDDHSNTAGGYSYHHPPQQELEREPYHYRQPPILPMLPMVPQMDQIDLFDVTTIGNNDASGANNSSSSCSKSNSRRTSENTAVYEQQEYYGSRPVSYQQQELVMTPWDYQQQQQRQSYDHHGSITTTTTTMASPAQHRLSRQYQEVVEHHLHHGNTPSHPSVECVPVLQKPQQY